MKVVWFYIIQYLALIYTFVHSAPATPGIPCKNNDCGIHVFRVALSSRPEEEGALVQVKQRKKYGSNVFAPRGSADSFNLNLVREVVDNMPRHIDPRVKDRVHDADFVMMPVEGPPPDALPTSGGQTPPLWMVGENEKIPQNFQVPFSSSSTQKTPSPAPAARFPIELVAMLVVVGILMGILGTCVVYVICSYSRKPTIDRSQMIVYRRPTEEERLVLEQHRRFLAERHRTIDSRNSIAQSYASSRTPRPPPRKPRRMMEGRAVAREIESLRGERASRDGSF